jgi:hypothetical protein
MSCDTQKYQCGLVIPSSCVPYTGSDLTSISSPSLLPCNANINDVITLLDGVLKIQVDGNNLTGLDPQCLDFDPATINPAQLHQVEIDKICGLDASLTALTDQVNNLNIGTMLISINMQCLAASVTPCEQPGNTFQLIAVLNAMLSEICNLKAAVGI